MKTTNKIQNIKLVNEVYEKIAVASKLNKEIKILKEEIKSIMGEDNSTDFGEDFVTILKETTRSSCDWKEAMQNGIDLEAYLNSKTIKSLSIVRK